MLNKLSCLRIAVPMGLVLLAVSSAFAQSPPTEKELIAVLQSSETPKAEKAIACKKLAIHGSSAAVPELARLLPDPQLSSWARTALEVIPGPEADDALRSGAESLEGLLLVGTINSIGVRRDAKAVELLTTRLAEKDEEVASAAAVALGKIANDASVKLLRGALAGKSAKVRSAVAEGLVLCAERLHAEGYAPKAVEIYDEVRKADVHKQRLIEATRGAILARGGEGGPLLLEQLRSPDKGFFHLGLSTFREFPGSEIDSALAKELEKAPADRAAYLIFAMADRPETVLVSAITQAASEGPKPVRLAAVESLAKVGDASCLGTLLEVALESDGELSQAAKESLADLPGEKIDAELVAMLPKAEGKAYPLLIELVGERRISAQPELLKALEHSNETVRGAALKALGETVTIKGLPVLIAQAVKPKSPQDAPAAQAALKAASVRMPDREACAEQLAMALDHAPGSTKTLLLEILGEVGGTKSLSTLAKAAKSEDPELQDTSSRLLGRWNSVEAAPVLLDLAKTAPENKYKVRALRGYIGLARKFAMPEAERAAMCQKALETAKQTAEKQLVLDVLKLHPSAEGLKLAASAIKVPELKPAATEATLVIAQKVKGKGANIKQLLAEAGLESVKLEIVNATYGAGANQRDVTAVLKKQAGELPLVTLPAASYNASFGGDPAPGTAKKLKVQYRINGQDAEATFDEDAVIIFPMPK